MSEEKMIAQLQQKYHQQSPLTHGEIEWCLHHLADTRPEVRDDLSYSVLAQGILDGILTKEQVRWIANEIYQTDALFQQIERRGEATLYRSFIALVWGVLVLVDGDRSSYYPDVLTREEREYILNSGVRYLQLEQDYTGYDKSYGWVHAIAHGADLMGAILSHSQCPLSMGEQALKAVTDIFESATIPFVDEEEQRLGMAIFSGIQSNNVKQSQMVQWMREQRFDLLDGTNTVYYRWTMYKHFLASIYFRLEREGLFETELREEMMTVLMDY